MAARPLYMVGTIGGNILQADMALAGRMKTFIARSAILGPAIMSFVRYGSADMGVQFAERNNDGFDRMRTLKYALFGFLYSGLVSGPMVVKLYPRIIPQLGRFGGAKMAAFDVLCVTPALYFPIFYMVTYKLQKDGSVKLALNEYSHNIKNDVWCHARYWLPILSLNFTLVPPIYRQYVAASVGFVWSAYLSYLKK